MKKFILFYQFVNYNKCGETMKEKMIITGASSGMGKENEFFHKKKSAYILCLYDKIKITNINQGRKCL